MRRALATVLMVVALLGLNSGTAHAVDIPLPPGPGIPFVDVNVDCAEDVTVDNPGSGPAASIDPGPATPGTGSPLAPWEDTPTVSAYEMYGYGGLSWPSLQDQCDMGDLIGNNAAHPGDSAAGTVANIALTGLSVACALVALVLRLAFNPAALALFDPIMELAADALGDNVFKALFWLTIAATGLLILYKSTKARFADSAKGAGWVVLAMCVGLLAMLWPLTVAPVIDNALTKTVGAVNSAMAQGGGSTQLSAADGAAANLHRALLYETWCSGMVGRGSGATADEFCPKLFAASTFSREEWEKAQGDADYASELAAAKAETFKEVAEDLKKSDPAAFAFLSGQKNTDRIWYAVLGWLGFLCASPWLFMAGLLLLYALVVVRLAIMVLPAVVIPGGFPPLRKYLTGVFDYVAGAILTALIFGTLAAVFVSMIGAFMSPTLGISPLAAMILLLITTIAAWKFTKPMRKVKSLTEVRKRFSTSTKPAGDAVNPSRYDEDGPKAPKPSDGGGIFVPQQPQSAYAGATPAEAAPSFFKSTAQGALQGAAVTAAAGLVSGGTVTAAGAAANAARGAGAAAAGRALSGGSSVAQGLGSRGATAPETRDTAAASSAPIALSGPATNDPAPRVYKPGETAGQDARLVEPTTEAGERVYPIYTPATEKGASL